jgi:hypothetical protein
MDAPEPQDPSPAGDPIPAQRRKKRWGEETEAGKKLLEEAAPEPKKRRSRWEDQPSTPSGLPAGLNSSIVLPAALMALVDLNPETLELQRQLNALNNKLQIMNTGAFVDDTPPERRSPSPPPLYNDSGARINTREQRLKEKVMKERGVSVTPCMVASHATILRHGILSRVGMSIPQALASRCCDPH